jgi:hypothetical protein
LLFNRSKGLEQVRSTVGVSNGKARRSTRVLPHSTAEMHMNMKLKLAMAAFGLAAVVSAPAQAQDCDNASFSTSFAVPFAFAACFDDPTDLPGGNAWDAEGSTLATYLNTALPDGAIWTGVEKVDYVNGGGTGTFFNFVQSGAIGTIDFTPDLAAGWFAVAFKQGNTNAVYGFNSAESVAWLGFDLTGVFSRDDISNISFWQGRLCGEDCSNDPFSVPEPSSLAMMFAGLFGLGVAARRRRNG